jgi:hypothetical protein
VKVRQEKKPEKKALGYHHHYDILSQWRCGPGAMVTSRENQTDHLWRVPYLVVGVEHGPYIVIGRVVVNRRPQGGRYR